MLAYNIRYLKSNMDRFIVATPFDFSTTDLDLKSNMDRFIVNLNCNVVLSDVI